MTSVVFGGLGLDILYVTSAKLGLNDEALKKQPAAGNVFAIRRLGVTGVPSVSYVRI